MQTALSPSLAAAPWARLFRALFALTLLVWATGCASLPANTQRTTSKAYATPEQTSLGQLVQGRRSQGAAKRDSAFLLLDGPQSAFTSRLALIDNAERALDLQYYAIHADASTAVLLERLRQAARRGVRVRILLDDFNSVGVDAQVLRLAFEPNVELRLFNPVPGSRQSMVARILGSLHDIERLQKRMHNKLFIADNAWGIAGGRNLGDQYFGTGETQNFVDLDVLAAGRIVRDMSASFDRFWNDELAFPVQTLMEPADLEAMRKPLPPSSAPSAGSGPAASPGAAVAASAPAAAASTSVLPTVTAAQAAEADRTPTDLRKVDLVWAPSTLMVDQPGKVGPGDDEVSAGDTVIDGLLHLIQQAQRDVLIVSPYFVPGAEMMNIYAQLRKRGVRVRVLTNSLASNDAPAAHAGYSRYRRDLLKMGVELYEMHSDPAVVPDQKDKARETQRTPAAVVTGGPGGSKAGASRASLHSKAVMIDGRLAVIGSMNLDLRSQLKNSEVGLVIRSSALTQQATRQVETTLGKAAYRVEERLGALYWRAPAGAPFKDARGEPMATAKQRMMLMMVAPFAPDDML